MYTVRFSANLKTAKIPTHDYLKIKEKLLLLTQDPRPRWVEKLKTRSSYRLAVGDYRVIYLIDDKQNLVLIIDIGHRKDIYKKR